MVRLTVLVLLAASCTQHRVVPFGICSDVHKDFMQPQDYYASFLNIWNSDKL
jgi:hypothetical protein